MLEHLNIKITPEEAGLHLEQLGVDEDSYDTIMTDHIGLPGTTPHELKTLVTIARSHIPRHYGRTYLSMKTLYPEGKIMG